MHTFVGNWHLQLFRLMVTLILNNPYQVPVTVNGSEGRPPFFKIQKTGLLKRKFALF